jgi:hypothetical protein
LWKASFVQKFLGSPITKIQGRNAEQQRGQKNGGAASESCEEMPWMSDKMPSLPNGVRATTNGNAAQRTLELKSQADIKAAEKQILSSTENLNEILSLIALVDVYAPSNGYLIQGTNVNMTTEAASSLAKIFMRFRKHGKLTLTTGVPQDSPQAQIVNWLNERYHDFVGNLLGLIGSDKTNLQVF